MIKTIAAVVVASCVLAPLAYADSGHAKKSSTSSGHSSSESSAKPAGNAAQAGDMVDGEIRKVDKDAKKITIKHGPLENLDMPAMTMVFQVKDPAMLDRVKAGDKVKFQAEKVNGAFTVVQIEPAR